MIPAVGIEPSARADKVQVIDSTYRPNRYKREKERFALRGCYAASRNCHNNLASYGAAWGWASAVTTLDA